MKMMIALAAFIRVLGTAPAQTPDCGLVSGFEQKGPAREFGPDNLYDYMDGNAEGYLIYRFVRLRGHLQERRGQHPDRRFRDGRSRIWHTAYSPQTAAPRSRYCRSGRADR